MAVKYILRSFIQCQARLSRRFDQLLPGYLSVDGNYEFRTGYAVSQLRDRPNSVIYDVGGGKNPHIDLELKRQIKATVVGLDISQSELNAAPPGAYDRTVCAGVDKTELSLAQPKFSPGPGLLRW